MKYAITGSGGFIGGHLSNTLLGRGDEILKIEHSKLYDFLDLSSMLDLFNPDIIISNHAYGNMSSQQEWDMIFDANVVGTYNLLRATKDIPYKAFVNVSSSSIRLPHVTMYAATKQGAEMLCRAFVDEYHKPIVTVRPYSVYGSGEADFRFIPTVFRSCLTGEPMTLAPDAAHDWIYVSDVVKYMLKSAEEADKNKGYAMDIGTGIATSNKEIVSLIEKITGKKANITEEKKLRSFDNQYWHDAGVKEDVISLQEGLQKYYESLT